MTLPKDLRAVLQSRRQQSILRVLNRHDDPIRARDVANAMGDDMHTSDVSSSAARMRKRGLVEHDWDRSLSDPDNRAHYYSITERGEEIADRLTDAQEVRY